MLQRKPLAAALLLCALSAAPTFAADEPVKETAKTTLGLYVTAKEAWQMLQDNPQALLVDVRDPVEVKFTGFSTETDIHVPWMIADPTKWSEKQGSWAMVPNPEFDQQLIAKLNELGATEDTPVIVMCRSGSTRSAPVVDRLAERGYTNAWTVVDGFEGSTLKEGDSKGVRALNGWRNSGLPWSYKIDPTVAWKPRGDME